MRPAVLAALAAFPILALSACAPPANWKEYAYPEQEFAVSFPGEPKISHQNWSGHPGFLAEYATVSGDFVVTVIDAGGIDASGDALLSMASTKLAEAVGGTVKMTAYDSAGDGSLGRRVTIAKAGSSDVTGRVFFYHHRLYEVGDFRPSSADDAAAKKFMDSFRLTPAAGAPAPAGAAPAPAKKS